MPTITPSLWFDGNLEEAAEFYTSVFPNSSIGTFARYTEAGPGTPGEVVSGTFVLDGQEFVGINGGPEFPFSEAVRVGDILFVSGAIGSDSTGRLVPGMIVSVDLDIPSRSSRLGD